MVMMGVQSTEIDDQGRWMVLKLDLITPCREDVHINWRWTVFQIYEIGKPIVYNNSFSLNLIVSRTFLYIVKFECKSVFHDHDFWKQLIKIF